jgi:excisionase family DNA binding protein
MSQAKIEPAPTSHDSLAEMPLLIPVPRAAQLLGISRSAAYRCVASGEIPSTHLGGRVYVVTSKLQSLLESP